MRRPRSPHTPDRRPRILLGVTVATSLILMRGMPGLLAERGWDVHIVSGPGPEQDALCGISGVTVHTVPMARNPSPVADLGSLVRWWRLLRTVRPDVISVGTPKAGLIGGLAARMTGGSRRIYMLRGLRLETTSGIGARVLTALERLSTRVADVVLAVSPSLRAEAIERRLVAPEKIIVLGSGSSNGVDLDAFTPSRFTPDETEDLRRSLGLVQGPPVIGFVGRLTDDKGLASLAEARRILDDEGVDHQLLLVGGVDTDAAVDDRLQMLRVSGRRPVETGAVAETAQYYGLMDVLCLPTLREGFPNVVLEAAASGIPAVTTDATGAVDSVVDGETGLIAHAGSAESLASALATILGDAAMRRRMGAAARKRVQREYDRRLVADRTEQFYRSELKRSGPVWTVAGEAMAE